MGSNNKKYLDYDGVNHLISKLKEERIDTNLLDLRNALSDTFGGYVFSETQIESMLTKARFDLLNDGDERKRNLFNIDAEDISYDALFESSNLTICPAIICKSYNQTAKGMFMNSQNLIAVQQINAQDITDMRNMFNGCTSLIYSPEIHAESCEQFSSMFAGCGNLKKVNRIYFNTNSDAIISIDDMFAGCSQLRILKPLVNLHNIYEPLNLRDATYLFANENLDYDAETFTSMFTDFADNLGTNTDGNIQDIIISQQVYEAIVEFISEEYLESIRNEKLWNFTT